LWPGFENFADVDFRVPVSVDSPGSTPVMPVQRISFVEQRINGIENLKNPLDK
jgi:hypothetical protein